MATKATGAYVVYGVSDSESETNVIEVLTEASGFAQGKKLVATAAGVEWQADEAPVVQPSPSTGNQLISGGVVTWSGTGFIYNISPAVVKINGAQYSIAGGQVTLGAADGSNPRIDVFCANTSSAFEAVAGTAASEPVKPSVSSVTQLELSFAIVAASTTSPSDVVSVDIYKEGSEWTGTKNGTPITLASTSSPITGANSLLAVSSVTGNWFQYANSISLDLAQYDNLIFDIKPSSSSGFPATYALDFRWSQGNTVRGQSVSLKHGQHGFDGTSTSTQRIAIPLKLFGAAGLLVDRIRATASGSGTASYRIDNIGLQGGVRQTTDVVEPFEQLLAMSDLSTALATGTGKAYFRAPYALTLTNISTSLQTVSSSGLVTVDMNKNGTTMLSTKCSIDANEKTSVTAAAPPVFSATAVAKDDIIDFDIDAAGTGAKGLIVTVQGYRN